MLISPSSTVWKDTQRLYIRFGVSGCQRMKRNCKFLRLLSRPSSWQATCSCHAYFYEIRNRPRHQRNSNNIPWPLSQAWAWQTRESWQRLRISPGLVRAYALPWTLVVTNCQKKRGSCTVQGRQGVWQGLSQDAAGSRWQVRSVQRRETNYESKTTAATDRHDFHQCRSEVCWQDWRHEIQRSNRFQCGVGGRVNHQEIAHVMLCPWILSDMIIHIKNVNDIIMFSKIVWHF